MSSAAFCGIKKTEHEEAMNVKKWTALLLILLLLPLPAMGESYKIKDRRTSVTYDSETLKYQLEFLKLNGTECYLTTVWVQDPARQILKVISPWHQALSKADDLAAQIKGAALVINGSGYVSPQYPEIPEEYPGQSPDYYYTPLGSLTVVDGEVYRKLEGVPYYGLTLEEDGLHMYAGADNDAVLARHPIQTWSFYEGCPMAQDGQDILDHDWDFANRRAVRTIICKLKEENTYLILSATWIHGLTLIEANEFLLGEFDTEWIYDLDGGPSSALLRRKKDKTKMVRVELSKTTQKIVDVMGFVE